MDAGVGLTRRAAGPISLIASRATPGRNSRAIGDLVRLAATGALKLTIEKAFPLEEAAEACARQHATGPNGEDRISRMKAPA